MEKRSTSFFPSAAGQDHSGVSVAYEIARMQTLNVHGGLDEIAECVLTSFVSMSRAGNSISPTRYPWECSMNAVAKGAPASGHA